MDLPQWALVILVLLPAAAGFPIFVYGLVQVFRFGTTLPWHKRVEVKWADIPFCKYNPYNIIFQPQYLTDTGQQRRILLFRYLLVWLVGFVLVFTSKALMDHLNAL